jgi:serine/threonine protein kinase
VHAPTASPDPLIDHTLLGRYKVVRMLGEGSMGKVYLGEQRIGEGVRQVAIKVLASPTGNDDYIIARFRREATTIGSLEHPNIIKLYDYGEEHGYFVSVMEYVSGGSLAHLIAHGPLDPARGEAIAWQIARALHAAHERGIVHRDLKPENILLMPPQEGGVPVVKVVDFGIARRPPQKPGERALTMTGTMLGTPAFMAPEQFAGGDVDRRADVYALGLVIYQMFSGVLPWPARSIPEWMEAHLSLAPTPLRQQAGCAHLPPRYDYALARALDKDLHRRTPNTLALLQDLTGEGAPEAAPAPAPAAPSVRVVTGPGMPAPPAPPAGSVAGVPGAPVAAVAPRRWGIVLALAVASAASLLGGFVVMRKVLGAEESVRAVNGTSDFDQRQDENTAQAEARRLLGEAMRFAEADDLTKALQAYDRAQLVLQGADTALAAGEYESLRDRIEPMGVRAVQALLRQTPPDCRGAETLLARLNAPPLAADRPARQAYLPRCTHTNRPGAAPPPSMVPMPGESAPHPEPPGLAAPPPVLPRSPSRHHRPR